MDCDEPGEPMVTVAVQDATVFTLRRSVALMSETIKSLGNFDDEVRRPRDGRVGPEPSFAGRSDRGCDPATARDDGRHESHCELLRVSSRSSIPE